MEGKVDKNSDLISDLPLSILHNILSYLYYKDLIRTSVLSKQWNSARKSLPVLFFEPPNELKYLSVMKPELKERLGEFLNFVDKTLQYFVQNKLRIDAMNLDNFCVDPDSVPIVDTWLPLALHKGVTHLSFNGYVVSDEIGGLHYALLETTFAVNPTLFSGSSKFFSLEQLALSKVSLSERIVEDIIKNCPRINFLFLSDICGLKTLNISKLDKLVSLHVLVATRFHEFSSISVDALSLEHFSFCAPGKYLTCKIDLTTCSNLRQIELHSISISDAKFHHHISRFPLLEVLSISCCSSLRRISVPLQRLKHLRVFACYGLSLIEIEAPLLSSYEFTHWDEFKWPTFDSSKLSFNPYKLRKPLTPPRVEVGCLDLTSLAIKYSDWWWVTLLNRLLWSCYPRILLMTSNSVDGDNCVMILCKMLMHIYPQYRCRVRRCKCWWRRLKDAKIESIKNNEEIKHKQFPLPLETCWSIPPRSEVRIRLDWDLSAIEESCHGLDFLDSFYLSSRVYK